MQEWIIAMLVISVILMIRDMAKTFCAEKREKSEVQLQMGGQHPQKEKVEKYAESFQKLADSFYGMPYRKDYLSTRQREEIRFCTVRDVCDYCFQCESCWGEKRSQMERGTEMLIQSLENGNEESFKDTKSDWAGVCCKSVSFVDTLTGAFQREKQDLIWNNRMIENRLAVALQLTETAKILKRVAENYYEMMPAQPEFRDKLKKSLRKHQVLLKQVWVLDKVEGKQQYFLNLRSRGGQCVSMLEVSQVLSEVCQCAMAPVEGSRGIVNSELHTTSFVEDVHFQVRYGIARLTREEESVSGDSYSCRQGAEGRFVMCLSDGMGSGMDACKESENVVDLLEQFLDTGFSQETAVRMINSALILQGKEGMFSTVDICALDLYSGVCNFLKAGAAATFIRRDRWVEAIESESLAAGLVQQMDFDTACRKLYHGDYLIMMTDGVLDSLPAQHEKETMKEIILDLKEEAPKEMSRGILERVLGYCDYRARDDMTVLVAGIWKK